MTLKMRNPVLDSDHIGKSIQLRTYMDGWMDGLRMEPFDASFLALPMSSSQKVVI